MESNYLVDDNMNSIIFKFIHLSKVFKTYKIEDTHDGWIGVGLAWTKPFQCLHICTITLKKWAFSLARSLVLMHLTCVLKSILPLSFQLESLNFFVLLQHFDGTLKGPLCNEYDKFLVKILSYLLDAQLGNVQSLRWPFCDPQANEFSKHYLVGHEFFF